MNYDNFNSHNGTSDTKINTNTEKTQRTRVLSTKVSVEDY